MPDLRWNDRENLFTRLRGQNPIETGNYATKRIFTLIERRSSDGSLNPLRVAATSTARRESNYGLTLEKSEVEWIGSVFVILRIMSGDIEYFLASFSLSFPSIFVPWLNLFDITI